MDRVLVLLSTYNGEQYLEEQLNSVLAQQEVDLRMLIRDDGSKDRTLEILQNYAEKDSRLQVYSGPNKGASGSFFELIEKAGDADYYSFCDQDDVWDPEKLLEGIKLIKSRKTESPILYYSNLKIVDENLKYYRMAHSSPHVLDNKYSAIVGNMASGCTMILNKTAMELIQSRIPESCEMHDWWIYLVCSFFGQLVYDMNGYIKYRQHSDNYAGTYLNKITFPFIAKRIRTLMNPDGEPRYVLARCLLECFSDKMDHNDYKKVKEFVDYKKSIRANLRLLLDKDFHGANKKRDLLYRVCILLRIA